MAPSKARTHVQGAANTSRDRACTSVRDDRDDEAWIAHTGSPLPGSSQDSRDPAKVDVVKESTCCPLCMQINIAMPIPMHKDVGKHSCRCCRACQRSWMTLTNSGLVQQSLCPLCELPMCFDAASLSAISHEEESLGRDADDVTPQMCGVCEEAPGKQTCTQCGFALCPACIASTHTKGRFKEHDLVDCETSLTSERFDRCAVHTGHTLELYCRTCSTCACLKCCFGGQHTAHDVLPLLEAADETRRDLNRIATSLGTLSPAADGVESTLRDEVLPAFNAQVADTKKELRDCFARLRKILDDREECLLQELQLSSNEVLESLQLTMAAGEALSRRTREAQTNVVKCVSSMAPMRLMRFAGLVRSRGTSLQHSLKKQLESMTDFASSTQSFVKGNLLEGGIRRVAEFSAASDGNSREAEANLCRSLSKVGDVRVMDLRDCVYTGGKTASVPVIEHAVPRLEQELIATHSAIANLSQSRRTEAHRCLVSGAHSSQSTSIMDLPTKVGGSLSRPHELQVGHDIGPTSSLPSSFRSSYVSQRSTSPLKLKRQRSVSPDSALQCGLGIPLLGSKTTSIAPVGNQRSVTPGMARSARLELQL